MRLLIHDIFIADDYGKHVSQHGLLNLAADSASATAGHNSQLITFTAQGKQRFTNSFNERRGLFAVVSNPYFISDLPKLLSQSQGFVSAVPVGRILCLINIM